MPESESYVAGLAAWSQDVRAALRRLDPLQRRVLSMIYFERFTEAQVAQELKVPLRTVARSTATGLQALAVVVLASGAD